MSGWLIAFALAGLVLLALWRSRMVSRAGLEIALVAVLIAMAGYAWQGSPDMAGNPVSRSAE